MADEIRPTPRSPILGLFSDLVNLPLQYMSAPQRTQQMQGVAEFIRGTGVPSTLERLSYGQGLFTGAGGLGGTTRLRPEVAEAALTVAPMVGPAARMTRGLPVGASIKNVGESIAQAPSKAIRRFDNGGLEVGYERDGSRLLVTVAPAAKNDRMLSASLENIGGYPSGTGDATMAYVDALEAVTKNARGKPVYWDGFTSESIQSPQAKAIYDRLKAAGIPFEKNVFDTSSKDALSLTQQQLLDIDFDDVRRRLIESAARKSSKYPQEEALRLAQQRAALPVSEGGLGLPPNNTPMDRAKAMGFVEDVYHGTGRDFPAFESGQVSTHTAGSMPSTMHWVGKEPTIADSYAMANYFGGTPTVMPLMLRSEQRIVKEMKGKNPRDLPLSSTDVFAERQFKRNKSADVIELQKFNDPGTPGWSGYGTHLAVKDPSQLRSRFAAFDPTRRNEPDLLAGALPFTVLIDEENRRAMDEFLSNPIMYRDPFGSTAR